MDLLKSSPIPIVFVIIQRNSPETRKIPPSHFLPKQLQLRHRNQRLLPLGKTKAGSAPLTGISDKSYTM